MNIPKFDEPTDQIYYWKKQYEELVSNYSHLFTHENELYKNQLTEITENHEQKLKMLDEWRENSEASIQKDIETKIEFLNYDKEKRIAEIPHFMKQSIFKQFKNLKNEFSDVFDYFSNLDIPFINEFSKNDDDFAYNVDLSNHHSFLSQDEALKDKHKTENIYTKNFKFDQGQMTDGEYLYRIGGDVSVRFGKMHAFLAKIIDIGSDHIQVLGPNCSKPICIPYSSLNTGLVKITKI